MEKTLRTRSKPKTLAAGKKVAKSAKKATGDKTFKAKRPKVTREKPTTIYVGNLNYKMEEDDILNLFRDFGSVKSVKIVPNDKGTKKGIAFVVMPWKRDAVEAIRTLDGQVVWDRTLKVSEAIDGFKLDDEEMKKMKMAKAKALKEEKTEPKKNVKRSKKAETGLKVLMDFLGKK